MQVGGLLGSGLLFRRSVRCPNGTLSLVNILHLQRICEGTSELFMRNLP